MKLLFISEFLVDSSGKITGGDEARTFYTAKYLATLGHEVSILTSLLPGTKSFEKIAQVSVYRVGLKRPYIQSGDVINRLVMFPLAILWQGLKLDFDIVDGNSVAAWPLARILGILKWKKVVYFVPDVLGESWQSVLGKIPGLIASLIESSCAFFPPEKIIALSEMTKQKLLKLGSSAKRISVVYPGVLEIGKPKTNLHRPVRLVSVQRLVPYKRADLVIEAIARSNLEYYLIGDGSEKTRLENLAASLGVSSRVKFLGRLERKKLTQVLKSGDIFILPSETEGFGIVTLDAMAQGLPFINSDIPVHQEIARISQAGLLFKSGDARDLARKIEKLTHDQKLYQKLSQNAIAFAQKHTWKIAAKEYENLLSD